MGFLDRFRKKKVEKEVVEKAVEPEETMSDLERICMGDKEVYKALRETMYLDPSNIQVTMQDAEKNAKDFEIQGNKLRARMWYQTAGGLAIYEGNVKKVKEYFGKLAELSPNTEYPILKIPEKAVSKAQEYYQDQKQKRLMAEKTSE